MTRTLESAIEEARSMGAEHGRAAASWYFDDADDATYVAVLRGIEDGDPAILETFPSGPLSGEWADDPTPTTLFRDLGLDAHAEATWNPAVFDDICSAYEDGFYDASADAIEAEARRYVGERPSVDFDAAYRVEGYGGIAWRLTGDYCAGKVTAVMVGDDARHTVNVEDLIPLGDLDYCAECGQVGCTHDGRDRT